MQIGPGNAFYRRQQASDPDNSLWTKCRCVDGLAWCLQKPWHCGDGWTCCKTSYANWKGSIWSWQCPVKRMQSVDVLGWCLQKPL
jgi:hypothetical protein